MDKDKALANAQEKLRAVRVKKSDKQRERYNNASPLFKALYDKNINEVLQLIDKNGCSIEEENEVGIKPIHIAATLGDPQLLRELISRGANVNPDSSGTKVMLPLTAACLNGFIENVKLLLEAGADVNRVDNTGLVSIWWVKYWQDKDVAKPICNMLLAAGAKPESDDDAEKAKKFRDSIKGDFWSILE